MPLYILSTFLISPSLTSLKAEFLCLLKPYIYTDTWFNPALPGSLLFPFLDVQTSFIARLNLYLQMCMYLFSYVKWFENCQPILQ